LNCGGRGPRFLAEFEGSYFLEKGRGGKDGRTGKRREGV